jgi:hypothetical protein
MPGRVLATLLLTCAGGPLGGFRAVYEHPPYIFPLPASSHTHRACHRLLPGTLISLSFIPLFYPPRHTIPLHVFLFAVACAAPPKSLILLGWEVGAEAPELWERGVGWYLKSLEENSLGFVRYQPPSRWEVGAVVWVSGYPSACLIAY